MTGNEKISMVFYGFFLNNKKSNVQMRQVTVIENPFQFNSISKQFLVIFKDIVTIPIIRYITFNSPLMVGKYLHHDDKLNSIMASTLQMKKVCRFQSEVQLTEL